MKIINAWLLALFAILIASCGGGGGGSGGGDNPLFTGEIVSNELTISPATEIINNGASLQYKALLSGASGQEDVTGRVVWSINDTSVATINSGGLAVAQAFGNVVVTARLDELSASANLEVAAPIISQVLSISPILNSLNVGTSDQYQAILLSQQGAPVDVTNQVVWSIDQTAIATIGNTGIVAAQSAGEAIVSANFNNLTGVASLTVTDKVITSLLVSPSEAVSLVGLQTPFFSTAVFEDGSTQDVTIDSSWISAMPADVSVGANTGLAVALAQTSSPMLITASFAGQTGQGSIEVLNANITELTVDPANAILPIDNLQAYRASLVLASNDVIDVSDQVQWSVSDSSIATISNEDFNRGLLQASSEGSSSVIATLTFASKTEVGSATLSVVPIALVSIAITPADVAVVRGTTGRFNATGTYNNQDERTITESVTWASSVTSVVNIEAGGVDAGNAYAVTPGSSVISATLSGIVGTASATVIAPALSRIDIVPSNLTIPLGVTQPFKAVAFFVDGNSQDITQLASWKSSDQTIAELEPRIAGQVQTLAVGQSNISATWNGFVGVSLLTVTDPMPINLSIVPGGARILPRNVDSNYKAFLEYSDNSAVDVTNQVIWSSADETIASISNGVDDEGRVHTFVGGATQISASLVLAVPAFTGSDSAGLTVLSGTVNLVRPSCLPKLLTVGQLVTCTCEAKISGTDEPYDCTSFATYTETPAGGRLNFSTRPGKNNTAIAVSPGPANVSIKFSGAGSNSSVSIE